MCVLEFFDYVSNASTKNINFPFWMSRDEFFILDSDSLFLMFAILSDTRVQLNGETFLEKFHGLKVVRTHLRSISRDRTSSGKLSPLRISTVLLILLGAELG